LKVTSGNSFEMTNVPSSVISYVPSSTCSMSSVSEPNSPVSVKKWE
jgi:hypothetical protein